MRTSSLARTSPHLTSRQDEDRRAQAGLSIGIYVCQVQRVGMPLSEMMGWHAMRRRATSIRHSLDVSYSVPHADTLVQGGGTEGGRG